MKNQRKKLLLLISLGMSMHMLTAMRHGVERAPVESSAQSQKPTEQAQAESLAAKNQKENAYRSNHTTPSRNQRAANVIDVQNMMEPNSEGAYELNTAAVGDLLNSHKLATEKAIQQKKSARQDVDLSNPNEVEALNLQPEAEFVTPAALLTSVLSESNNYQEAFNKLDPSKTKAAFPSRSQQLLLQQARTLLARAHPEVVPNLVANLRLLPNRFVSYFKEKLPTLTTEAGKQRFTQSIVMEAVKSMPELPQNAVKNRIVIDNPERFPVFQNKRLLTTQEKKQLIFDPNFNNQLSEITGKYAESLQDVTSIDMFMQWSRNLIVDVALLAPRVVGGVAGTAIGTAGGALHGTAQGINYAARAGYEKGGIIGGTTAGILVGAPFGLVAGAKNGAVSGAVRGANIV